MSKRLNKQYKKHCAFVWTVETLQLSNEFLLEEVLCELEYSDVPRRPGETDTEPTLQSIQEVREQKRPVPRGWMDGLKDLLCQLHDFRLARSDQFDISGAPAWYTKLPKQGDKLGEFLAIAELISVARDVPSFLLEDKPVQQPSD